MRTPATEPNIVIGRLERDVGTDAVARRLRLPGAVIDDGNSPFVVRRGPVRGDVFVERSRDDIVIDRDGIGGGIVVDRDNGPIFEGPVVTVPPLVKDAAVIGRFEQAIAQVGEVSAIADPVPTTQVVAFQLAAAATALTQRCDPAVRPHQPRRHDGPLRVGGARPDDRRHGGRGPHGRPAVRPDHGLPRAARRRATGCSHGTTATGCCRASTRSHRTP